MVSGSSHCDAVKNSYKDEPKSNSLDTIELGLTHIVHTTGDQQPFAQAMCHVAIETIQRLAYTQLILLNFSAYRTPWTTIY